HWQRFDVFVVARQEPMRRNKMVVRTSLTGDRRHVRLAQPGGRFDQRAQHRLQIKSRAADDLEHVGGGGLLLQRLAKFIEQPSVLDGDDRLVGEALDQLYLLPGKGANLLPIDGEGADQVIFLEHRNNEKRPEASQIDECDKSWFTLNVSGVRSDISDMNR